jgi:hypothetical protein
MIISLSGKIGSGKDTVAKIIQDITPTYEWKVKKFAGKLKEVATILSGVEIEKWEDQEFKQSQMSEEWGMTYRDFLQKIGTEAMRNGLHTNTWVNALFADYKIMLYPFNCTIDKHGELPNWIITDTRFPNEMEAVRNHVGIAIKVVRDSGNTIGTTHESETALDNYNDWDYVIENNGTIDDLKQKVYSILKERDLIEYSF